MKRVLVMLARLALTLALALGIASLAAAQTVANVLSEAGLLGRWANDCHRPPGSGNIHTSYAVSATGEVTVTYSFGAGAAPTVNVILNARQIAADRVAYHQENRANGARLDVEIALMPTHIRVWSSVRSTGEVLVKDGKFSDGSASPLQMRCN